MAGAPLKSKKAEEKPVFSTENIRLYLNPSNPQTLSQQLEKEGYIIIFRTFLTKDGPKNVLLATKEDITGDQLSNILSKFVLIQPKVQPKLTPEEAAKIEFKEALGKAGEAEEEFKKGKKEVEDLKKALPLLIKKEEEKEKAEEAKKKAEEEAKRKAEEEEEEEAKKKAEKEAGEIKPPATIPDLAQIATLKDINGGTGGKVEPQIELRPLESQEGSRTETAAVTPLSSEIVRTKLYGKPALFMKGIIKTSSSGITMEREDKEKNIGKNNIIPIKEIKNNKEIIHGYLLFGRGYLNINTDKNGYLTDKAKKEILKNIKEHMGITDKNLLGQIEKNVLDKIHAKK